VLVTRYTEVDWTTRPDLGGDDARAAADKTRIKRLHLGSPDRPVHFEMAVTTYPVPKSVKRHRHDTAQFRYTLAGTSPWAPGHETPEGGLLFIPAGTPYGPYERPVDVELLQVEFEGVAGSPFVDFDTLFEARQRLAARGRFEEGVYSWIDDAGSARRMPAGKACLEEAIGGEPLVPKTRFASPIEVLPDAFSWALIGPGVGVREFVTFPERGTRLAHLGLDAGARHRVDADRTTLLFTTRGRGELDGEPVGERDAVRIDPGESAELIAGPRFELLLLGLPTAEA
jgi:hypothetical protein